MSEALLREIYDEILKIKEKLELIEEAIIPTEELSEEEIKEIEKLKEESIKGESIEWEKVKKEELEVWDIYP